ncbi:hypothetical protein H9Q72_003979 [Fusarium xylarioides]|uniref:Rhodopsin domain-containing protein n=1 Tax=Fusarium xylarioides TaxID=221167 RepID=A0A9P7I2J2_9HYPO|nr:hypothetical protein H9Q72_003979 [Fusarium xylarioides]
MSAKPTRVPLALGIIVPLVCLTFFVVSLRIYTRVIIIKKIGVDDYWAIASFVLLFACAFDILWGINYGFGRHISSLTDEQRSNFMKVLYISILLYNFTLSAIKITFLAQYYRAFAVQGTKKILIVSIAIVSAWSLSQIFVVLLLCQPMAAFWDKSISGKCLPNNPQWYINAAGNIATDLLIILLPLPFLIKLNIPSRQRYALVAIFCPGFFTCAISGIRIRVLDLPEDCSWTNVKTASLSVAELSCGLLCACLPTLRPLISRFIPKVFSSRQRSRSYGTNNRWSMPPAT